MSELAFASGTMLYGYESGTLSQVSLSSTGGSLTQQWSVLVTGTTFDYSCGLIFGSNGQEFNPTLRQGPVSCKQRKKRASARYRKVRDGKSKDDGWPIQARHWLEWGQFLKSKKSGDKSPLLFHSPTQNIPTPCDEQP